MEISKFFCHRIPERSFFIKGHQFPVCARCTGFYTGLALYIIMNHFYPHGYNIEMLIISIILMTPVAIDGTTQYFGSRESTNPLRFATGLIGGVGLIIFFKTILWWIINVL